MNRKIKNATIVTYNGIEFKSQLEKRVFEFLEKQNLKPAYEKEKFKIWDCEKNNVLFFDKYGKEFQQITRKPVSIHYTPDIIFEYCGFTVYLEVKGFKNDVFNYKAKLFRDYLKDKPKSCFAVVYTLKNLEFLLSQLTQQQNENTF